MRSLKKKSENNENNERRGEKIKLFLVEWGMGRGEKTFAQANIKIEN